MIIDKLENCERYYGLGERFAKAFEYLKATDFSKVEPGKYPLDGDALKIAVQEYETRDEADCKIEAHKRYADIQFIYSGKEQMGIDSYTGQEPKTPYNEEKDVWFFDKYEFLLPVGEGSFTIFFPEDIHMPCFKLGEKSNVKKVVMKVLLD